MLNRRLLLTGLLGASAVACVAPAAKSESGLRIEPLEIVTADGRRARFKVEIADTEATRSRGLMERPPLADDAGMLFDFQTPRQVAFWMKNTPSPLDILFIDAQGRILNIAAQTTPYSEASLPSAGEALGVLEIRGGRAEELGVKPGDTVRHRIFR